jgi:hypothetical protein
MCGSSTRLPNAVNSSEELPINCGRLSVMSVVSVFYNRNFTSVCLKVRCTHLLHPFSFCKLHNFLRLFERQGKRQTEFIIAFLLAAGEMDLHCFNIDYFPREEYSPDPNDSTMAIPCKYQTA